MANMMCPHCGLIVELRDGLVCPHSERNGPIRVCPGTGQNPRCAESDGRPLWNGESNPHYYRNREV